MGHLGQVWTSAGNWSNSEAETHQTLAVLWLASATPGPRGSAPAGAPTGISSSGLDRGNDELLNADLLAKLDKELESARQAQLTVDSKRIQLYIQVTDSLCEFCENHPSVRRIYPTFCISMSSQFLSASHRIKRVIFVQAEKPGKEYHYKRFQPSQKEQADRAMICWHTRFKRTQGGSLCWGLVYLFADSQCIYR
jgi:hypothetical protein